MSFAQYVGNIDLPTAIFLATLCLGLTVVTTSMIIKRRSKQELTQEFELAKIREANSRELNLYVQEQKWLLDNKKIEQNLITSHRETSSD